MTATTCICVIDDDPDVCASLGSLLRSAGFDVILYDTPEAFLEGGRVAGASCLVLDIRLHGQSGLDFQDRLAALGHSLPIVLITGHGDIPMTVRGMRAGAVDVLPKPFSEEQILNAVSAAVEADRVRRAAAADTAALHRLYGRLTPREREVMALVVAGLMNKQVAGRLQLSEITVKIHRGNVMRKMEAQSLADLVRTAEALAVRDESAHRYQTSV